MKTVDQKPLLRQPPADSDRLYPNRCELVSCPRSHGRQKSSVVEWGTSGFGERFRIARVAEAWRCSPHLV